MPKVSTTRTEVEGKIYSTASVNAITGDQAYALAVVPDADKLAELHALENLKAELLTVSDEIARRVTDLLFELEHC